ncbi:MAG: glutamate synthase large subunit [Verrucomicrobiota bacterium]|nr:glutamate synthase large subunit [Verrucomicrobiota bacterium]
MHYGQIIDSRPEWKKSLYHIRNEHDNCGVGFVANIDGRKSNVILRKAIQSVINLTHRGAIDADQKTGDGAGVMTQIPHKLFIPEVQRLGYSLYQPQDLGIGMIFLPTDGYHQATCRNIVEETLKKRGLHHLGWREVPLNKRVLGDKAKATLPHIQQVFVGRKEKMTDDEYERALFLARNQIEKKVGELKIQDFYICSMSHRLIVYKGLLASNQLEKFYKDLQNPDYETALAIFHQRFSTNTFPTWSLAQAFRMIAHNGEINTINGNRIWMKAREAELQADFWGKDIDLLKPIIQPSLSDSASLDNALEVLVMSGRPVLHAMMMLVPPALSEIDDIDEETRGFFDFHACLNEPWDGPAALVYTDGITIGATLDRNGLRPARYKVTNDGMVLMGSEVGLVDVDDKNVVEKGRLGPGETIAIDTAKGALLRSDEIRKIYSKGKPYASWVKNNLVRLDAQFAQTPVPEPQGDIDILTNTQLQLAHGYNTEELSLVLKPMGERGEEGLGSMGDDTPLAVLSYQPRLLYTYFKQKFAQVTNPPIDPIRERLVMSLDCYLGHRPNLLGESEKHARLIRLSSPVVFNHELGELKNLGSKGFHSEAIDCVFQRSAGNEGLEPAIRRICAAAENAVDKGAALLVLSDKKTDHENVPVPMLLALGAVHHHLIRTGKRMRCSIIIESGEVRDVHQVACLVSYGASAVNPYLVFETFREMISKGGKEGVEGKTYAEALKNYRKAIDKGVLKIMSKMGISCVSSYRGAEIFEAIGIGEKVMSECFAGTESQISGICYPEIAAESICRYDLAFKHPDESVKLVDAGFYRNRQNGEMHAWTGPVIKNFHTFVKSGTQEEYKTYAEMARTQVPVALRHLLEFKKQPPIPLDEVEPVEEIRRRFTTAGMSLGALSPEAHETLAIAMNKIGGKSNSGEGGEDQGRFHRRPNGDFPNSAIKQVASGRFGVTAEYLASASEIEIKLAQGAKPGEGGQIPGMKVTSMIARLRRSMPGIMLISPPPHHDIYSIEDLAQLIYDLKEVNPRAKVCVKLVSEAGVGTIAAGVAKAYADVILISGHDGGTGASPLSSIKNAGGPWELGIAEAQQVLVMNGLRGRVVLRTDGGMKTGRDILMGALLGAEEYNFGTAAMISLGCVYVRQCHLNNCPVGVATQDEKYRAKFKGSPEMVINFFNGVAQEVREILASLGARSLNDVIGRTELLEQREVEGHPKANKINLGKLLFMPPYEEGSSRYHIIESNDRADRPLDEVILQDAKDALREKTPISLSYKVKNTNRSIGARLSGEIAYRYGDHGLPPDIIELKLKGSAGQSLGAFLVQGVKITLTGEANDYVGKGMSGGEIVVVPSPNAKYVLNQNVIIGNTVLYGATGGFLFALGRAGERFAVRNSGATAIVEGVGDHCCEYMTNGHVVVLGLTGKNFAAGMSGGFAYVFDEDGKFESRVNTEMVTVKSLTDLRDMESLKCLMTKYFDKTASFKAQTILADWEKYVAKFKKVIPHEPVIVPSPVPDQTQEAVLMKG